MFSHVVVSDFHQSLSEDLESVIGFGGVGSVELIVDLLGSDLGEKAFSVEERSVFDVEMHIAESKCQQC